MDENDGKPDLGGKTGEQTFLDRNQELRSQSADRRNIPCHIYFYQENPTSMIEIGSVPIEDSDRISSRVAVGHQPPAMISVILNSNMSRLDSIYKLFARFGLQDKMNKTHFKPDPKIMDTVKAVAQNWSILG